MDKMGLTLSCKDVSGSAMVLPTCSLAIGVQERFDQLNDSILEQLILRLI
jgi:hypothetical protein